MGSIYRDVGDALKHIYMEIPENLDNLSAETMREILCDIKLTAQSEYAAYAYALGWAESSADAVQNLINEQREFEKEEDIIAEPLAKTFLIITEWLSNKIGIPQEVEDYMIDETDKAIQTIKYNWIPKSQIVSRKDVEWIQTPPADCIPWLRDNIKLGDHVQIQHRVMGKDSTLEEGFIEGISYCDVSINGKVLLVGYMEKVTKFVRQEE
ncbi:hypothetical protein ACFVS2_25785 [Brevibacillus sp. NPDC058079]|uniref:hypothetical protein n=1 Tax=Brevibacillus sp. NPDC058079 TaxID=3346330 RepID=UPI0036ECDD08